MRMLAAVFAIGCSTPSVLLETVRTLEIEHPIVGVDSDRAGGVWVATRTPTVGGYDPDKITIAHVDANGVEDTRFVYTDDHSDVHGLAFSAGRLWVNYTDTNLYVRALNPATGEQVGSFALPLGIVDLEAYDNTLVLSNLWNQVITLDRATGGFISRVEIDVAGDSLQRGIAVTADAIWIADWAANLYRVATSHGKPTAFVEPFSLDGFDGTLQSHRGPYLAADGEMLIVAHDRRISWYAL